MSSATAGKHERDRRRRQQVRDRDRGAHREPLRARPRHDVVERVVEGHVQARAVARRGDRERVQMAVAHHAVQPLGVDQLARAASRAASCRAASAAGRAASARSPSRSTSSSASARRCGSRRTSRSGRPARRGSSPRRRRAPAIAWSKSSARQASAAALIAPADVPAMTGKGIAAGGAAVAADLRHRLQHADLVGGARAAAGEDQPGCACRVVIAAPGRPVAVARDDSQRSTLPAATAAQSVQDVTRRRWRSARASRLPALERAVARVEADRVAEVELADRASRAAAAGAPRRPCGISPCSVCDAARREVAQHLGDRRHAAVDLDAQVLAEAAARRRRGPRPAAR